MRSCGMSERKSRRGRPRRKIRTKNRSSRARVEKRGEKIEWKDTGEAEGMREDRDRTEKRVKWSVLPPSDRSPDT
jgi:hypothetical protein